MAREVRSRFQLAELWRGRFFNGGSYVCERVTNVRRAACSRAARILAGAHNGIIWSFASAIQRRVEHCGVRGAGGNPRGAELRSLARDTEGVACRGTNEPDVSYRP